MGDRPICRLRVVFFGTPDFAVPSLQMLLDSPHQVVGVVTQPDRPRGRGQHVSESPVKQQARQHGLVVLQPERIKEEGFLSALRELRVDLGVVAAYGKILPAAILQMPARGLVNVHASLLPRYRGAAPVHRAVLAGELETGVSIMHVVQALDAGAVYATARRPIGPDETSSEVEQDLAHLGAALLRDVISQLVSGRASTVPQNDSLATYASRLQKDEGVIDWTKGAQVIHNQVRGLQPWPLAWTYLAGRRLILMKTTVGVEASAGGLDLGMDPGTVVAVTSGAMRVQTGEGVLDVWRVQPEGRRAMTVSEFVAGHPLVAPARFDAPATSP
ncbi:MAG: methionyl-tRNA formyltransferase [Acidobacteriota bacterium]